MGWFSKGHQPFIKEYRAAKLAAIQNPTDENLDRFLSLDGEFYALGIIPSPKTSRLWKRQERAAGAYWVLRMDPRSRYLRNKKLSDAAALATARRGPIPAKPPKQPASVWRGTYSAFEMAKEAEKVKDWVPQPLSWD